MGEILNILRSMAMGEKVQASTGVADCCIQIIRNVCLEMGAILSTREWTVIKDIKEEASFLYQLIYQISHTTPTSSVTSSGPGVVSNDPLSSEMVSNSATTTDVPDITTLANEATSLHETSATTHIPQETRAKDNEMEEMFALMSKAMGDCDWEKVKYLLEDLILIINTDTGGQAEFLDLHASLVSGPSFNLLFSKLTDELDSLFKIYYTNEKGMSTAEEDSTMTMEEVLFQAIASVASYSGCFSSDDDTSSDGTEDKLFIHSKSKLMFVGTHRDLIDEAEFKKKDDFLQKKIKCTEFYKKDLVEFASENQLMLAVDNFTGGQDEIERIRRRLEAAIRKNFEKIEIPVAWLVLSFCIRSTKLRTMSLEECERLAGKLNISPQELEKALWFLHHCVGLLLYYPKLEALKGTVICDVQVVFDSASNLIKNTFTFDVVGQRVCEKFTKRGHFSQSDLEKAALKQTDKLLPLQKLVKLLEHLSILTPLPRSSAMQEPTYFMPCVLKSARASELVVTVSDSDPAPLMLRYECGYVPVGMFPAMITNLVSQQEQQSWKMIEEGLWKNKVQFEVGRDYDTVTLISHPRFFEVAITRTEDSEESNESLCSQVLNVIEDTLISVTSRMNYNFSMSYKFGFKCPVHSTREHLCIVADKAARRMQCLQDPRQTPLLGKTHSVWFARSNAPFSVSSTAATPTMSELISFPLGLAGCKVNLAEKIGDKYYEFGFLLLEDKISAIESEERGKVLNINRRIFQAWLQGKGKVPVSWATLIAVLQDTELKTLARDIETALKSSHS